MSERTTMNKKRQFQPTVRGLEDRLALSHAGAVMHGPPPAVHVAAVSREAARFEVDFLKGMIPHHQMAISMSQIALRNSDNPEVRGLARRIIGEQRPEVAEMKTMLSVWYGVRGYRPGMSPDDMKMLQDLRGLHGTAFDQAYLTDMIDHHRRAIGGDGMIMTGAQDVLARGIHPRLLKLAGNIVRTQTTEIREMTMILGTGTTSMPLMQG